MGGAYAAHVSPECVRNPELCLVDCGLDDLGVCIHLLLGYCRGRLAPLLFSMHQPLRPRRLDNRRR